jgi:hypothetical protein
MVCKLKGRRCPVALGRLGVRHALMAARSLIEQNQLLFNALHHLGPFFDIGAQEGVELVR